MIKAFELFIVVVPWAFKTMSNEHTHYDITKANTITA